MIARPCASPQLAISVARRPRYGLRVPPLATAAWLTPERSILLDRLADLIARGGSARFLDVPVVRADARDLSDPWTETRAAVERLLVRLLWLAYVDLDVELDDARVAARPSYEVLRRSAIVWLETVDGVARFQLEALGNDDVAGQLSHQLGLAYLAWIDGPAPYRELPRDASLADGSLAAVYLGLGVLAANSSSYHRHYADVRGNSTYAENQRVSEGGQTPEALTFLLAVQQVVRGAPIDAHATLQPTLRDWVRDAVDAIAPYRAELLAHLGLELDAPRPQLERAPAPPPVADDRHAEPDLRAFNHGRRTFRVRQTRVGQGIFLGMLAGVPVLITAMRYGLSIPIGLAGIAAAMVGGGVLGHRRRHFVCSEPRCSRRVAATDATCPGCGGTISGEIAHADDRLAREEELEEAEAARAR